MVVICISIWLASIIRFMDTGNSYISYVSSLAVYMPVYVLCHALCFYLFKLYNRIWKYAGIKEMLSIVGANACGMALFLALRSLIILTLGGHFLMSRALMVMCCGFNIALIAASRLFVRWASYRVEKADKENDNIDKRVLIVGAGDAGNIILRDLRQRDHRYVIGFIDDDPNKKGKIMNGIPVMGNRDDIHRLVYEKDNLDSLCGLSGRYLGLLGGENAAFLVAVPQPHAKPDCGPRSACSPS